MPKPTPTALPALAAGLVLATLVAAPAAAETSPTARTIWDRFAETCPPVVASADPATYATGLGGAGGGAGGGIGQSLDGRIRHSTLEMPDIAPDGGPAFLMTQVNRFDGGRTVQCMLQVVSLAESPAGLTDLARAEVGRVLGDGVALVSAGGPIVGMELGDGSGMPITGTEMVRISTEGFPPDAVMTVQVLPQVVILTLFVAEAQAE